MTARSVTYIDGVQVTGQDLRLLTTALLQPDSALSAASGVRVGASDLKVSANGTPNMSVNVAAGQAFIDGTESFAQGIFLASNDSTVNLAIAAADATNPRRDLIVARIYSETVTLASRRFALEVVTGSASPSPVDPSLPANSIVLARVSVAAAATSITSGAITDLRVVNVATGGTLPCLSTARPATPYAGQRIYETDTLRELIYNGAAWEFSAANNPVHAVIERSAGQTIATATETTVSFTTATRDVFGLWASGTPTRLTIPSGLAGLWRFEYTSAGFIPANGSGFVAIRKNGSAVCRHPQAGGGVSFGGAAVESYIMAAGDFVDVDLYVSSSTSPTSHKLVAHRISA